MSITLADFRTRFPEFDTVADERVELFIEDAELTLNESHWGAKYNLGLYYLTAHLLAVGGRTSTSSGAAGAFSSVASRAVDGTSISYNQPAIDRLGDSFYMQTAYGQRYINLRDSLRIPAYTI